MSNAFPQRWSFPLLLAVVAVVVAHTLLIAPQLTQGELDLDESLTFLVSTRPLPEVLVVPTQFQAQPPLFYLALHGLTKWSTEESAMRLLPWAFLLAAAATLLVADSEASPLARLVAAAALLLVDFSRQYLSFELRPYSLAAWLALASCLLFWKLLVKPGASLTSPPSVGGDDPPRAISTMAGYVIVTTLMMYSLSIAIWIVACETIVLMIAVASDMRRLELSAAVSRRRNIVVALLAVAVLSLPYLIAALRLQGHVGNPSLLASLRDGLNPRYYFSGPFYLLKAPDGLGFVAIGLAAVAALDSVRKPAPLVWFLMLVVALQIGLTHAFLAGRSGFAFRYLAPAFPALCLLVGLGADRLIGRFRWAPWLLLAIGLTVLVFASMTFLQTRGEDRAGPWRQLRADLLRMSGPKVVFFDVGWDGQRLQYEVRHDPDTRVLTDPATGLSWAGRLMSAEYVDRVIEANAGSARMFFYQFDPLWRSAVFDRTFLPAMLRLGCERTYERTVPTYVRNEPDRTRGALIVGFTCPARSR